MRRAVGLALFGVAVIVVGLGLGEASLLALGIAFAVYPSIALALISARARRSRLERSDLPARSVEGSPFELELRIVPGRPPIPGGTLTDPLLGAPLELTAGWRSTRRTIALEGRGRRRLAAPELELRDPLGVTTRTLRGSEARILILPRVEPIEPAGLEGADGAEAARAAVEAAGGSLEARGLEFEVDGLRPYRPGVSASRIHWPTVARTGEMVERRLAAGEGSATLVVVDSSEPEDERSLDAAVRAGASLVRALAPHGGCELRLSGEPRALHVGAGLEGWTEAHVHLALLQPGPAPVLRRDLAARAIFWVAARRIAAAPPGAPPKALVAVGPFEPADAAAFSVAGCFGRPLVRPGAHRAKAVAR